MTMLTAKQAYIRLEFLRGLGYYSGSFLAER